MLSIQDNSRYYLIEWDGYDLTDNTWEQESNVYSEKAINKFVTAYAKQYHKRASKALLNNDKKILLQNTYDPDTNTYFKSRALPKVASLNPITTTTKAFSTATTTSITTLASSSKRASIEIIHQQRRSNKRLKESIESETESVLVSKPLNKVRHFLCKQRFL